MRVFSIFKSLSGEVGEFAQGSPTIFIRFSGCNLKCSYCDTPKTQSRDWGVEMTVKEILQKVLVISNCNQVLITGGEPLTQDKDELYDLIEELYTHSYRVSIETNGSIKPPPEICLQDVYWIFDYKLSGSGMKDSMLPIKSFAYLPKGSWVKMVCSDLADVEEAIETIRQINNEIYSYRPGKSLPTRYRIRFALSTSDPKKLLFSTLASEILSYPTLQGVVLNVQLHKIIFPKGENEKKL